MTAEDRLAKWSEFSGMSVPQPESEFIADMRKAARAGVGYGWMQQIIEWEWQSVGSGAWGPELFNAENDRIHADLDEAVALLRQARWYVAFYEAAKHKGIKSDVENTADLAALDAFLAKQEPPSK